MSDTRHAVNDRIEASGLVAIVRANTPDGVVDACRAMIQGGLEAVEVTLTTPGALNAITQARQAMPEALVGVGSVTTPQQVRESVEAGAQFVVCPVGKVDVVQACHAADVPVVAGALTPSEILAMHEAGSDLIKVFPANHFGPTYFKDVLAPMPFLKLAPTGGVDLETIPDWFANGARCVGVGSSLVRKDLMARKAWDELTQLATQFVDRVRTAR